MGLPVWLAVALVVAEVCNGDGSGVSGCSLVLCGAVVLPLYNWVRLRAGPAAAYSSSQGLAILAVSAGFTAIN